MGMIRQKAVRTKVAKSQFLPHFFLAFSVTAKNGITDIVLKKLVFYMTESQVSSSTYGNEITAFVPTQ